MPSPSLSQQPSPPPSLLPRKGRPPTLPLSFFSKSSLPLPHPLTQNNPCLLSLSPQKTHLHLFLHSPSPNRQLPLSLFFLTANSPFLSPPSQQLPSLPPSHKTSRHRHSLSSSQNSRRRLPLPLSHNNYHRHHLPLHLLHLSPPPVTRSPSLPTTVLFLGKPTAATKHSNRHRHRLPLSHRKPSFTISLLLLPKKVGSSANHHRLLLCYEPRKEMKRAHSPLLC